MTSFAYTHRDARPDMDAGAAGASFQEEIAPPTPFPAGGARVKPIYVNMLIGDDETGSGNTWKVHIENSTEHVLTELGKRFAGIKYSYISMGDRAIGEKDKLRLQNATAEEVLREQKMLVREGGGDAAETFLWTMDDVLRDPALLPRTRSNEARGLLLLTTDDTKPLPDGRSLEEFAQQFRQSKIYLFVVGTPGSNMERVAQMCGGDFFALDLNPSAAEAERVAARLAQTVAATVRTPADGAGTTPATTVRAGDPVGTVPAG